MKSLNSFCLLGVVVLCQCTQVETIPDTMIPYEFAGHSADSVRDGYSMRELVYALPHVWEIGPGIRGAFLDELYPQSSGGMPDDFVEVPMGGAQTGFTAIRLDKDLVALTTHTELSDEYDRVFILRRIPGAWQDLTTRLLPFSFVRESRVIGLRDKSISIRGSDGRAEVRYIWDGSRFLQDQHPAGIKPTE